MGTEFRLDGDNGRSNACYRWSPAGEPSAVLVLAHGMGEHARRYGRFAEALAGAGIETFAIDHQGHGRTVAGPDELGRLGPGGWLGVVDDYRRLVGHAAHERPGAPIVAFGHSLGSFLVQQFLLDHSGEVVAAVLSGSAALDQLALLVDPSAPMDLTLLNGPFAPARTDFDWLSRDEAEVDRYVADPLCGFGLEPAGLESWLAAAGRTTEATALAAIRDGFPVYLMAGGADPVNAAYTWLDLLAERYEAAGLDVTKAYYDDARHEILNETNRDEITADVMSWLVGVLDRHAGSTISPG